MNVPVLTDRQIQILKYIIEEHIQSGDAVGSETLDKKYNLGVSPATIRNEMVVLTKQGYLEQHHTSSGRVPTARSLKFYIRQLMKEKDLSVAEEVDVKSKIWDHRKEVDDLLFETTRLLAQKTNSIGVALTDDGHVYHSGYANILAIPEFFNIDVTRMVFSILDDQAQLKFYLQKSHTPDIIQILIGDDFGEEFLLPCGLVYTNFDFGDYGSGKIGILGPSRLDYPYVIPVVKYFGTLLNEIGKKYKD